MVSMKKKIIPRLRTLINQAFFDQDDLVRDLDKLERELRILEPSIKKTKSIKILMGPSFSIYGPCFLHDRILSYALRLRGATILPVYCDSIQEVECNVSGGVWKGNSFKATCEYCRKRSELLWKSNPDKPFQLSSFLSKEDRTHVDAIVGDLGEDWADFREGSFLLGKWAKDILVNNYVVGDYHLIPDHDALGRAHLRNLLLLKAAYLRVFQTVKPDRVVTNDSYYGMWAILQVICHQNDIPLYSHWMGGRSDGWCYAYDDAAMNLDFSKPWVTFKDKPLSERQIQRVKDWIDTRPTGKGMILDTASLQAFNLDDFDLSRIDVSKPTALLPSNVIWDLAALNKQILFSDMIDWIVQTISWFADHPDYQLIIKPHPGELHPDIPKTEERVETALDRRNVNFPANVFLLSPHVDCTVYDLLPISTVGIVHTTTVGIEMAARGLPVITTGKSPYRGFGFTLDPSTPEEYYLMLERCLSGKEVVGRGEMIDRAYKFIMFYQFHYYSKIDIMEYSWGKSPKNKIRSISDLAPGNNVTLDYFSDTIMEGKPIVSEERWPPES
jgi:hypothetical protein